MKAKTGKEHRRFTRIPFVTRAELQANNRTVTAEVLDVSLKGALVHVPSGWHGNIGDETVLELQISEGVIIRMQSRLAHLEDERAGFTCHHIDLDSAGHLRRLIELNLSDDAQLHRELEAMIKPPIR